MITFSKDTQLLYTVSEYDIWTAFVGIQLVENLYLGVQSNSSGQSQPLQLSINLHSFFPLCTKHVISFSGESDSKCHPVTRSDLKLESLICEYCFLGSGKLQPDIQFIFS